MSSQLPALRPPAGLIPFRGGALPPQAPLGQAIRAPARLGFLLILVFLGGFLAWGFLVPIAGGAIAPGVISPDGNRRTVQHLEGGIISELRVRDGDMVAAGQPLVVLEGLQARAVLNALRHRFRTLRATEARLMAEQNNATRLVFPPELASGSPDAELTTILTGQQALFAARRLAHASRRQVLGQRIEQSQEQIRGLEAQVASAKAQLGLIADELAGKKQLLRQGLVPRPDVLRLQRAEAEIGGQLGEHLAAIATARQAISEARMQILSLEADRLDQIAEQLEKLRPELADVGERLLASDDVLSRTVVTAPVSGTVVGLRFSTVGGVIRAGEAILDLVPAEETLLIDAHVAPLDIDVVQAGLVAQVRLTAYSSRGLPRIDGTVRTVSADRLTDQATGQSYYLARVEVPREALRELADQISLVPGMPAEVLVVRRQRTMVQYLMEPFLAAFRRSFREV